MNLSVSNIAWNREEWTPALEILKQNKISAIDIAPTLIFDSIDDLTKDKIIAECEKYENLGIKMVAMQSLLFGAPCKSLFDGDDERECIFRRLEKILFIAEGLGIKNLVFGSPKNRYIKNKSSQNIKTAIDFFRKLCDVAIGLKLNICLEANPKEYNCNFITTTFEAVDFIKKVDRNNFLLNLDTSTIILNNNDFKEVFNYSLGHIGHIHISAPFIKEISNINNKEISDLLKLYDYQGYVSLEMKPNITKDNLKNLEQNVKILKEYYAEDS